MSTPPPTPFWDQVWNAFAQKKDKDFHGWPDLPEFAAGRWFMPLGKWPHDNIGRNEQALRRTVNNALSKAESDDIHNAFVDQYGTHLSQSFDWWGFFAAATTADNPLYCPRARSLFDRWVASETGGMIGANVLAPFPAQLDGKNPEAIGPKVFATKWRHNQLGSAENLPETRLLHEALRWLLQTGSLPGLRRFPALKQDMDIVNEVLRTAVRLLYTASQEDVPPDWQPDIAAGLDGNHAQAFDRHYQSCPPPHDGPTASAVSPTLAPPNPAPQMEAATRADDCWVNIEHSSLLKDKGVLRSKFIKPRLDTYRMLTPPGVTLRQARRGRQATEKPAKRVVAYITMLECLLDEVAPCLTRLRALAQELSSHTATAATSAP